MVTPSAHSQLDELTRKGVTYQHQHIEILRMHRVGIAKYYVHVIVHVIFKLVSLREGFVDNTLRLQFSDYVILSSR